MIDREFAENFAQEWIAAWNSHDIERIFAHYVDDFEMSSPLIVERMGVAEGTLRGKDAIRPYWSMGLAVKPPLKFELIGVYVGANSIGILYRSVTRRRTVIERIEFNDALLATRAEGIYGPSEK